MLHFSVLLVSPWSQVSVLVLPFSASSAPPRLDPDVLSYSSSSRFRGQLLFSSRDNARSARILSPVWQRAQ